MNDRIETGPGPGTGTASPPGLLGRVLGFAVGAVVLVVSLIFSVVVFAILLAVAVLGGAYLWWRTRELRRRIREQMQAQDAGRGAMPGGASDAGRPPATDDDVLEGDFIREARRDDQKGPDR